jgi:hypothetical protein
MSTKYLARTVIEGGRARYNRFERRHSNSCERRRERVVSSLLLRSKEPEMAVYPVRKVVYRAFRDKLSPAERWLESQVGRPWSKVRSELFARFDTRTTAGRHILFDHLLKDVNTGQVERYRSDDFHVDRHGILRENAPRSPWRGTRYIPLPEPAATLEEWLGDRRIGAHGTRLYWFVPTPNGAFRQHRELGEKDAERWHSLPDWWKERAELANAPKPNETR